GIYCYNHCSPSLKNVLISDNTSQYGGGICCFENSSPNLENVTITDNSASSSGGGIFCYDASPVLINSILWNNSPQEIYIQSGSVTATYSDIQGALWTGDGNINVDPLFVGTGEHPFSLQDLSPCVNAGIPDTTGLNLPEYDLAGNPRVYGGRIDMGAYENQNVAVDANENLIPLVTKLNQNYPNPFNPTTTINYFLKENSKVSLNIYNIKGQKVKTLVNEVIPAGEHSVLWNGRDTNGNQVSSGIYFYKLKTANFEKTRKMILLK
nr:T9SS type A sorting domain-containing protein [Bacteroidota bacterium]